MRHFAYGSNMNLQRLRSRDIVPSGQEHAVLEGYVLRFNKQASRNPDEGYANVVPDPQGTVEGVLYEISESDMAELDGHEGYPDHYDKQSLTVKLEEDTEVEAIVYVARPVQVRDGLRPTREYLDHLLAARDLLSDSYYEYLESIATLD